MSPSATPLLEVEGLCKSFGPRQVLCGVDLRVDKGAVFTVLGPSGAGKSVLLKCLADVLQPDKGALRFEGQTMNFRDARQRRDFHRRCSFLFQGNALFDSLTALENVALPLEQTTRLPRSEILRRSLHALEQLELAEHAHEYPAQLSGGMQKRLALARALVTQPELVFFDEPTAGLDPLRRNAVFLMIAKYQRQFGFTALVVSHDLTEALAASNRVALLDRGRIRFIGTPQEFEASAEPVVCAFRDNAQALRSALSQLNGHASPGPSTPPPLSTATASTPAANTPATTAP